MQLLNSLLSITPGPAISPVALSYTPRDLHEIRQIRNAYREHGPHSQAQLEANPMPVVQINNAHQYMSNVFGSSRVKFDSPLQQNEKKYI